MAPRANWKGFLRLSLVTCPVALYPATSESEKVSFNQLNRKTGHRIKYAKVDADTGEEVANEDIVKGYKVDTDTFIEVTKEELENVALESTRTIEIDEFVDRSEIDPRYLIRPYYLVPDGKVGHDAFAVIRETIREMSKVAIGRVVLTNREHIIALDPLDKGLMGTLLRYPYEVRSEKEYFDDIQDVKVTKDMLDLAKHIVNQKAGHFEPDKFEDQYETAFMEPIYQGGLEAVTPGSSCIANAYTSNHELISSGRVGSFKSFTLHVVDAVGLVHAMLLRIQALLLPIKTLVLSGH